MKIRNVENGKTAEVPEVLGRHLIGTRNFVAEDDDAVKEVEAAKPAKKRARRYRRRDMRPEE